MGMVRYSYNQRSELREVSDGNGQILTKLATRALLDIRREWSDIHTTCDWSTRIEWIDKHILNDWSYVNKISDVRGVYLLKMCQQAVWFMRFTQICTLIESLNITQQSFLFYKSIIKEEEKKNGKTQSAYFIYIFVHNLLSSNSFIITSDVILSLEWLAECKFSILTLMGADGYL